MAEILGLDFGIDQFRLCDLDFQIGEAGRTEDSKIQKEEIEKLIKRQRRIRD